MKKYMIMIDPAKWDGPNDVGQYFDGERWQEKPTVFSESDKDGILVQYGWDPKDIHHRVIAVEVPPPDFLKKETKRKIDPTRL